MKKTPRPRFFLRKSVTPQPHDLMAVPVHGEITSTDNLLPDVNGEIGLIGENPVRSATDLTGDTSLREAGAAGGDSMIDVGQKRAEQTAANQTGNPDYLPGQ